MKKALLIVLVLFAANTFFAQTKILVNTGLSFPSSGEYFSDYLSSGVNLGGGVEFPINHQLSVQAYINYNHYTLNTDKLRTTFDNLNDRTFTGGSVNGINICADLKYYFVDNIQILRPFVLGGLGYSSLSFSTLVVTEDGNSSNSDLSSLSNFSINFGIGAEYAVSPKVSIFMDVRYVVIFSSNDNLQLKVDTRSGTMVQGDNLSYIPIRLGVSFSL
jgi:opacity protein-like surface antigen